MKFPGFNLREDCGNKNDAEDSGADKITGALRLGGRFPEPRHGYRVARGFAERCCEDLNDPE